MSNGSEACCALGICCPPASAEQTAALAKIITDDTDINGKLTAADAAACVLEHFDLAPKGTIQDFVKQIARLARKHTDV